MIINNSLNILKLLNKSHLHKIFEGKIIFNKIVAVKFLKPKINFRSNKKKFITKWYLDSFIETLNYKKYNFFAEKTYKLQSKYLYFSEKKKEKQGNFVNLKYYNVKPTLRQVVYHGEKKKITRFAPIVNLKKRPIHNIKLIKYKFNFFLINLQHKITIFMLNLVEKHKVGFICENYYIDLLIGHFIYSTRIFKMKSMGFWLICKELFININLLNVILKKLIHKIVYKKFSNKLLQRYLLVYRYICILIRLTLKVFKRIPKRVAGLMLHILSFFYFWYFNSVLEHKKNKNYILSLKKYFKGYNNNLAIIRYTQTFGKENIFQLKKSILITFYNFLYYIFYIAKNILKYKINLRKSIIGFTSTQKPKKPTPPWFLKFFEHAQYYKRIKSYLRFKFKGKKNVNFRKRKKKFRLTTLHKRTRRGIFL